jgi:hypothetical protein
MDTAANRPAAHFQVDLCRKGITELKTGDVQVKGTDPDPSMTNEPVPGSGDEKGCHIAASEESEMGL